MPKINFNHLPNLEISAIFSEDKKYRYRLTIVNKSCIKGDTLCVIMQNPSIANIEIADKSVQFLEKLVFEKKVRPFKKIQKMVIVNQFALVQTKDFSGTKKAIGVQNDIIIQESIEKADYVLIAWGKTNPYDERQEAIHNFLEDMDCKNIFATKKHPSRGTYQDFIISYSF